MEIVAKTKIGLFQKFPVGAQKWKSQAHKRNWTWNFIEQRTPADVWHLCIDADEEIVLPREMRSLREFRCSRKIGIVGLKELRTMRI